MMDNEQPRQPPQPPPTHLTPKITAQVPEVTLFSPANRPPAINRPNILQRAGNKVSSVQQSPPVIVPQVPMTKQQSYSSSIPAAKPSVPDLSLFDAKQQNPMIQRRPSSSPSNLACQNPAQVSKDRILDVMGQHSVPDVTILEDPKSQRPNTNGSGAVFDESYKNMLMNTHNEFMKQFRADNPRATTEAPKKKGFFSSQPEYQANPLLKYAPKPVNAAVIRPPKELDASSPSRSLEKAPESLQESDEKIDELTFKKVNAMLSEIQKLVIDKTTTPEASNGEKSEPTKPAPTRSDILRRLAFQYLTPEEIRLYEVEDELTELENEETEDSS